MSAPALAAAYMVNRDQPQDLVLRLFVSDAVPSETELLADYQEPAFPGYSARTLAGGDWSPVRGMEGLLTCREQAFEVAADCEPVKVYGYFLTLADGMLVYAERFRGPFVVQRRGDKVLIRARLRVT